MARLYAHDDGRARSRCVSFAATARYRADVGSTYADPVEFVSYFHGDYAVHSMNRPSYGWPQSLGCVELPFSVARQVWPYLTYGTLVTVTEPAPASGTRPAAARSSILV
jgi:hypothetical protein